MAEEVVIKYRIDTSEFGKVGVAVTDVSKKVDDLKAKAQTAFASGQIDAATNKLIQQGDTMGALIERYGSATKALKAMEKELATMAALGQRNTKEFKELANATAQLKDNVQDTRGEIRKMASDTRVFDTMVQGARGVAAAFSVATGLAAALGDENKDLQKTLLKVQGAMAALQGVQELANIATEKGGIATKAYGAALQVVDKISKVTGLSMAASWALATAGLTAVLGLIAYFISSTGDANEESEQLNKTLAKQREELEELEIEYEKASGKIDAYTASIKLLELERKRQLSAISDDAEKAALDKSNGFLFKLVNAFSPGAAAYMQSREYVKQYGKSMGEAAPQIEGINRIIDEQIAIKRAEHQKELNEKAARESEAELNKVMKRQIDAMRELDQMVVTTLNAQQEFTNAFKNIQESTDEPMITEKTVSENKVNVDQMAQDLKNAYAQAQSEAERKRAYIKNFWEQVPQQTIAAVSNLSSAIFANVSQNLDQQERAALKRAGDNVRKREKIEKEFAYKQAKIQREQAVVNKILGLAGVVINTAQGVMKNIAQVGTLAAQPLNAMTIALGAIQAAAIAAAPLPPVPKFEKGGRVLAGGRKDDGMLYGRSHRQGGILIEAQGGEYIWDIPTVKKHGDVIKAAHENRLEQHVFHKYVVPQMQKGRAVQAQNESYDDFMLRTTVKNSSERSADRIVREIRSLKNDGYLISRYG